MPGITIKRCILTVYPAEMEKAPGFSPPTTESDRRGEAHTLPAGHPSDNLGQGGEKRGN